MIYNYNVIPVETAHYNHRKINGKKIHNKNSNEFIVVHCLSIHPDGITFNENYEKKPAFINAGIALDFMKKNSLGVSADCFIMPSGLRYEFYVPGIPEDEISFNHAGKSEFKGKTFLNTKSRGVELYRDCTKPIDKQYTDDQYKSLADWCYERIVNFNNITTHKNVAVPAGRKTDPDFFDWAKFEQEFYTVMDIANGPTEQYI